MVADAVAMNMACAFWDYSRPDLLSNTFRAFDDGRTSCPPAINDPASTLDVACERWDFSRPDIFAERGRCFLLRTLSHGDTAAIRDAAFYAD
jgi:hypothetical protein